MCSCFPISLWNTRSESNVLKSEYKVFALRASKELGAYTTIAQWKRELDPTSDAFIAEDSERALRREGIEWFEANYRADYRDVPMTHCEVSIDGSRGMQTVELWRKMLLQTHYADHSKASACLTIHGTSFHFSSGGMAGTAPYIAPDSNLDLLISMTATMGRLCWSNAPAEGGQLRREADALLAPLQH